MKKLYIKEIAICFVLLPSLTLCAIVKRLDVGLITTQKRSHLCQSNIVDVYTQLTHKNELIALDVTHTQHKLLFLRNTRNSIKHTVLASNAFEIKCHFHESLYPTATIFERVHSFVLQFYIHQTHYINRYSSVCFIVLLRICILYCIKADRYKLSIDKKTTISHNLLHIYSLFKSVCIHKKYNFIHLKDTPLVQCSLHNNINICIRYN